jgi:hypothetical protein
MHVKETPALGLVRFSECPSLAPEILLYPPLAETFVRG